MFNKFLIGNVVGMKHIPLKTTIPVIVFSILIVSVSANFAFAESVPEWVKNTAGWWAEGLVSDGEFVNALWYGQRIVSESEVLNAIKFLIENDIIVLDSVDEVVSKVLDATVTIPNGNFNVASTGFYSPLNLEIPAGTTVTWVNEDSVPHNVKSQDEDGKVTDVFNSPMLNTGDRFEFTFEEEGIYKYHCSWHPWRVGLVTVN